MANANNKLFMAYDAPKCMAEHGLQLPGLDLPTSMMLQQLLASGLLQPLPAQLSAVGASLCDLLPVPWLCNNPGCTNMACDSEAKMVGGKACCCAGCKVAR